MRAIRWANLGVVLAACGGINCTSWLCAQSSAFEPRRVGGDGAAAGSGLGPSAIMPSGADALVISAGPADPRWPAQAGIVMVDHRIGRTRSLGSARYWLTGGVRDDVRDGRRLAVDDRLFVQRYESLCGAELWSLRLDTGAWAAMGQTIAGELGGEPRLLTGSPSGNTVYFVAYDQTMRERLWRCDPDSGEIAAALPAASAWSIAPLGPDVMVMAYALDQAQTVLWRLRDREPAAIVAVFPGEFPGGMAAADGAIEFATSASSDSAQDTTVWRSNGTFQGTIALGIVPGRAEMLHSPGGGGPRFLRTYITDGLYELWSLTPPPESGSRRLAGPFEEIGSWAWVGASDSGGGGGGEGEGRLVFSASNPRDPARRELWVSDGTRTGTHWLNTPGISAFRDAAVWCSDGASVYFTASEPLTGSELWRTDGGAGGATRLTDIAPGPTSSMPRHAAVINHRVYFGAMDESGQEDLWAIDLCPADFNNDGLADALDLMDFLSCFFAADPRCDIDGDGSVTSMDLTRWVAAWQPGC